jgi:hypothetical protein
MMLCHHLRHHFDWALVIKTLARANIQRVGNGVQLLLTMTGQVCALGQVLADQTIDIFIATALPGTMRVTEVDRYASALGDFGMARHLAALVIGERLARRQRHAVQGSAEAFHGRSGGGVMHLHQHQVTRAALYQRANRRGIGFALDQIALPLGRHTGGRVSSGLPPPAGAHGC